MNKYGNGEMKITGKPRLVTNANRKRADSRRQTLCCTFRMKFAKIKILNFSNKILKRVLIDGADVCKCMVAIC